MAWTTPGTATAGEVLTAAFWNTQVRDNMIELAPFNAAWTTWTPTFTNVTTTSGTLTAKYLKVGRFVQFSVRFVLGASSAITGDVTMTLPVARADARGGVYSGTLTDTGAANYAAAILTNSTDTSQILIRALGAAGSYATQSFLSSTIPFTWGTGDEFFVSGSYEAAS